MMTERRFNDQEVASILERAATAPSGLMRTAPAAEGMTLSELQDIAREVGIAPEAVAAAARSADLDDRQATRRFLGVPVGVSVTGDLGRPVGAHEWERLVADARETFDARGRVREDGAFREWTNGNLHVLVEPTPTGHRLRMRTYKSDGFMIAGLSLLGVSAVSVIAKIAGFQSIQVMGLELLGAWSSVAGMVALGGGLFTVGALRVMSWARTRRTQMEGILARLRRGA
jgi:hypothetical protein